MAFRALILLAVSQWTQAYHNSAMSSRNRLTIHRMVSEVNEEILQSVAERAARSAGRLMLAGMQESDLNVESKIGSRDIVTRVDKEVQESIRSW